MRALSPPAPAIVIVFPPATVTPPAAVVAGVVTCQAARRRVVGRGCSPQRLLEQASRQPTTSSRACGCRGRLIRATTAPATPCCATAASISGRGSRGSAAAWHDPLYAAVPRRAIVPSLLRCRLTAPLPGTTAAAAPACSTPPPAVILVLVTPPVIALARPVAVSAASAGAASSSCTRRGAAGRPVILHMHIIVWRAAVAITRAAWSQGLVFDKQCTHVEYGTAVPFGVPRHRIRRGTRQD